MEHFEEFIEDNFKESFYITLWNGTSANIFYWTPFEYKIHCKVSYQLLVYLSQYYNDEIFTLFAARGILSKKHVSLLTVNTADRQGPLPHIPGGH